MHNFVNSAKTTPLMALFIVLAMISSILMFEISGASALNEDRVSDSNNIDDDHVIVETFTFTGDQVSVDAFDAFGNSIDVPADFRSRGIVRAPNGIALKSGDGGSSSASGCIRITVNNEKESLLRFTLFWYHTWTSWCWNRSAKTTYSIATGWSISDVDPTFEWQGNILEYGNHYSWSAGYPESGYAHERQGHFKQCIWVGCVGNYYPHNWLYSFSNGTYSWRTED